MRLVCSGGGRSDGGDGDDDGDGKRVSPIKANILPTSIIWFSAFAKANVVRPMTTAELANCIF